MNRMTRCQQRRGWRVGDTLLRSVSATPRMEAQPFLFATCVFVRGGKAYRPGDLERCQTGRLWLPSGPPRRADVSRESKRRRKFHPGGRVEAETLCRSELRHTVRFAACYYTHYSASKNGRHSPSFSPYACSYAAGGHSVLDLERRQQCQVNGSNRQMRSGSTSVLGRSVSAP